MTTIGGISKPPIRRCLSAASREAARAFRESYRIGAQEPRPPQVDLAELDKGEGWAKRHRMTKAASVSLPENLRNNHDLFGHYWPSRYVYELGPGKIDSLSGLVFHKKSVIAQSGPPLRDLPSVAAIAGSHQRLINSRLPLREISGSVFPLGREPITGYYHWLIDFLPRVLHVRRLLPDTTFVAPKIKSAVRGCLEALAVKFVETTDIVVADNIVLADHTSPEWCHPEDVQALHHWGASLATPLDGVTKIYVSRRGARRAVEGEEAIEVFLKDRGFFVPDIRAFRDFPSQVAAWLGARTIVGPFGAGLSNMVWAAPRAHVVAVSAQPTSETSLTEVAAVTDIYRTPHHRNLSASCGHQYWDLTIPSRRGAPYGKAVDVLKQLERYV